MPMRDTPPPNLQHTPRTPSQWREVTIDDCTWYATIYCLDYVSHGHVYMSPIALRGTVDPDLTGPTTLTQTIKAVEARWPDSFSIAQSPQAAIGITDAITALQAGAALIVQGDYQNLPHHYRRWTYNDDFAHSIACVTFDPDIKLSPTSRGATWMYDPLGGGRTYQPYKGEWISVEHLLQDFAWTVGPNKILASYDLNRSDPVITVPDSIQLPTATVRVNTHAREHPHANSEIRKTFKTRGTVKVLGHVGPYWTAIVTSIEDASMDKVLYIRRSAILTQTAIPASGCADAVNELTVALAEANDTIDSVRRLVTP